MMVSLVYGFDFFESLNFTKIQRLEGVNTSSDYFNES